MLSVIIPVWNAAPEELCAAVESARAAKVASDIVLVDDHSDRLDTIAAIQEQAERGARVVMSRHRRSCRGARATGVHTAREDFVLHLDADDTISAPVGWRHDGAPVALSVPRGPMDLWDFIDDPRPQRWGAIVRTDLSREIERVGEDHEEDFAWGYRVLLCAWRDRLPVTRSDLDYRWRSCAGRDTMSTRFGANPISLESLRRQHLEDALRELWLTKRDRDQVRWWADRRGKVAPITRTHGSGRVDVHVLSYLGHREWLEQCLGSLAEEPCTVHLVAGGFPGSIGAARAFAFGLGASDLVSFVDDDDFVEPGAMQACIDYLDGHPDCVGVYTDVEHLHPAGRRDRERKGPWCPLRQLTYCPEITHLKVMRRSAVMACLSELALWPTYEEYVLCGLLAGYGRWAHVPIIGAVKRCKPAASSSMRLASNDLWRRAVARVTSTLISAKALAN